MHCVVLFGLSVLFVLVGSSCNLLCVFWLGVFFVLPLYCCVSVLVVYCVGWVIRMLLLRCCAVSYIVLLCYCRVVLLC